MSMRIQRRPKLAACATLVGASVICAGFANQPLRAAEPSVEAATRCRTIADGVARLSCYDRLFGVVVAAGTAVPATPTGATTIPANSEQGFGLTAEQREQRSRAPTDERRGELQELSAKVTNINQPRAGRFTITLDNGQVWQQRETDASIYIRPGDNVTIKKALLGSYLLVTEDRRSTKVERLK
ncbi:MAG TPA: hypothetical protein P5528_02700 [Steroidobacteraceae bacterium]|nr:hypothetical protein [Steroidobacteraceae bacterium]HRX88332.1 hypothetical protein [Steroidobacteraceae bacterium]